MTPATLFLILVSLAGVSAVRWSLRLAPFATEFPAKTTIATLLAGFAAAHGLGLVDAPSELRLAGLVLGPIFVFAPLLMLALVRSGSWRIAAALLGALYWTEQGRGAVGRLLAQAAVQAGDPEAAKALVVHADGLLIAQARRLEGDWEGVLQAPLPERSEAPDNLAIGYEARVEALLALNRHAEAEHEAQRLERFFSAGHDSPVAFRALTMTAARLAAEQGEIERVRQLLTQPMVGANPGVLYAIMARAAETAGRIDVAVRLLEQAYAAATGSLRRRYAEDLTRLGGTVPASVAKTRTKTPATYALMAFLALAYLGQEAVDRLNGLVRVLGQVFEPSSLIAAYLQGLPGIPAGDAWWRFVTYGFVHGNVVHIGFNLWVLLDLGRLYERRRGWGDLIAAFVAGTVGGALLTSVAQAGQPLILVGASGGILAIAGALLADALLRRSAEDRLLLRSLLQWMALIMLFSVLPGVSLWGHAGGLAGGFVYGLLRALAPSPLVGRSLGAAATVTMAIALGTAIVTVMPLLP